MIDRRALLQGLGVASASTLLGAFGCGSTTPVVRRADGTKDEVRTWLRDGLARLGAVFPAVHMLAVQRDRTIAVLDVLGTGVTRARRDGVVITVRAQDGAIREEVTSDLSAAGVLAAVRSLVGGSANARARLTLGPPPPPPRGPVRIDDRGLAVRLARLTERDRAINSRVVYAAAAIDIDDTAVWSLTPTHDREQRYSRVAKRVTRAAWNGTRPVVAEAVRGWNGAVDDQDLDRQTIEHATEMALLLVTPGAFADRVAPVVLDPSLTAALVDTGTHALLTTDAARRPEVKRRLAAAATVASSLVTLIDDPTVASAYGGFTFDDEGELARPLTLLDGGRFVNLVADGGKGRARRPGHVGPSAPVASHLRVVGGKDAPGSLFADGLALEGLLDIVVDQRTSRVVIGAARARELVGGKTTGRVWADVELVGELGALLAAVDGVSTSTVVVPIRTVDASGEPTWRSVDAPYVRTRGLVRSRRSRA